MPVLSVELVARKPEIETKIPGWTPIVSQMMVEKATLW